jgi:hypothetical protein
VLAEEELAVAAAGEERWSGTGRRPVRWRVLDE